MKSKSPLPVRVRTQTGLSPFLKEENIFSLSVLKGETKNPPPFYKREVGRDFAVYGLCLYHAGFLSAILFYPPALDSDSGFAGMTKPSILYGFQSSKSGRGINIFY
jgi:hypothetical protein